MNSDLNRFLLTLESGRVTRYHACPTVAPQTDAAHAWGVALLCIYLTGGNASAELVADALLHDSAEIVTGDIPYTTKRDSPELKALLAIVEDRAQRDRLMPRYQLTEEERGILKIADTLEGWLWCRKTEHPLYIGRRWHTALMASFDKFRGCVSDEIINRAKLLAVSPLIPED